MSGLFRCLPVSTLTGSGSSSTAGSTVLAISTFGQLIPKRKCAQNHNNYWYGNFKV